MLPLSPEPTRSSTGNSIESVEQPWRVANVGATLRMGDQFQGVVFIGVAVGREAESR